VQLVTEQDLVVTSDTAKSSGGATAAGATGVEEKAGTTPSQELPRVSSANTSQPELNKMGKPREPARKKRGRPRDSKPSYTFKVDKQPQQPKRFVRNASKARYTSYPSGQPQTQTAYGPNGYGQMVSSGFQQSPVVPHPHTPIIPAQSPVQHAQIPNVDNMDHDRESMEALLQDDGLGWPNRFSTHPSGSVRPNSHSTRFNQATGPSQSSVYGSQFEPTAQSAGFGNGFDVSFGYDATPTSAQSTYGGGFDGMFPPQSSQPFGSHFEVPRFNNGLEAPYSQPGVEFNSPFATSPQSTHSTNLFEQPNMLGTNTDVSTTPSQPSYTEHSTSITPVPPPGSKASSNQPEHIPNEPLVAYYVGGGRKVYGPPPATGKK
jgi:hypothetical protein